jgi:hypothetical protein
MGAEGIDVVCVVWLDRMDGPGRWFEWLGSSPPCPSLNYLLLPPPCSSALIFPLAQEKAPAPAWKRHRSIRGNPPHRANSYTTTIPYYRRIAALSPRRVRRAAAPPPTSTSRLQLSIDRTSQSQLRFQSHTRHPALNSAHLALGRS